MKTKKIILLILSTLLFLISSLYIILSKKSSDITTIKSFKEVDFKDISSETLVIFDVNDTIYQAVDTYLANEESPQAYDFRTKVIKQHPEVQDWNILSSIVLDETKRVLIEPSIIETINQLKNRHIPVIALNGLGTGSFGIIKSLPEWRYNQLKSLGFEGSFESLIFSLELDGHPMFYKGLLATGIPAKDKPYKGPVLGSFLDYMKLQPNQMIMFDDSKEALLSVAQECKKRNIKFHGYEYKGAHIPKWNEPLVEFQLNYLIKHKKWLSDEQAQTIMISKGI